MSASRKRASDMVEKAAVILMDFSDLMVAVHFSDTLDAASDGALGLLQVQAARIGPSLVALEKELAERRGFESDAAVEVPRGLLESAARDLFRLYDSLEARCVDEGMGMSSSWWGVHERAEALRDLARGTKDRGDS